MAFVAPLLCPLYVERRTRIQALLRGFRVRDVVGFVRFLYLYRAGCAY